MLELLIVLGILPLVIGAIAVVTISSFHNQAITSSRFATSHDAQITAAYFVRDVQSSITVTSQTGVSTCSSDGSSTQLLGLSWTNAQGQAVRVSYGLSIGTNPTFLVRRSCVDSAKPITTNVSVELFNGLSTPTVSNSCGGPTSCAVSGAQTIASVTVNCGDGTTTCANSGPVTTYAAGGSPGIKSIVLFVHEGQSKFQYTLVASPRNQNSAAGATPPGSTGPPLVLLGSGSAVLKCSGSGKGPVTVYGAAAVNSSSPGSIVLNGNDMLQASEVYTQSTAPVSPASAYTGPYVVGPKISDPYAGLPDPSTAGLTTYGSGGLNGPGIYTSIVSVTSTTTMASGTYIFEKGIKISGTTKLTGSGVFIFIGVPNSSAAQNAGFQLIGTAVANLSPMTTGPYAGVLIFEARTNIGTLQIAGLGSTSTYGGAIYAPDATVDTSGNGGVATGSIVSNSMSCGGNGGASIGGPFPQVTFPVAGQSYTTNGSNPGSWAGQNPCSPNQAICGTAVDLSGVVTTIQMSLQSGSKCWDGTLPSGKASFSASCPKYITVSSSGTSWYQAWSQTYLGKGTYTLTIEAIDNAGFSRTTTISFTIS